ncbi:MAG: hypothetical protein ACYC3I_11555 [Gemmataceae bacterium]
MQIVEKSTILFIQRLNILAVFDAFGRCAMTLLRLVAPLFLLGLLSSSVLLGDDKKTDPVPVNVRLPQNFSKLGLTVKQKNDVLKIRAKYAVEIQKLKEQIAALTEQEKADVENLLTTTQKSRLRELRGGGAEKEKEIDKPIGEKKK